MGLSFEIGTHEPGRRVSRALSKDRDEAWAVRRMPKGLLGGEPLSDASFAKRAGHTIVAVFKETASGADNARPEQAILALARGREIDAILVTELSRWGRSTQDLVQTLADLHGWKVSVLAQTRSASISAPRAAS
jgi:Resolvase, N terminal domain